MWNRLAKERGKQFSEVLRDWEWGESRVKEECEETLESEREAESEFGVRVKETPASITKATTLNNRNSH